MTRNIFINCVILCNIYFHLVEATKVCLTHDVFGRIRYLTCADSCCGTVDDKYCCQSTEVGIIAGSVVGVVVFFGLAVSVITCCCCHRNRRDGYVKVTEGPTNYESTTHYDIPRTPPGPQISVEESFRAENRRIADGENESVTEVLHVIEAEIDAVLERVESEPNPTDDLIVEVPTEISVNETDDKVLMTDALESTSIDISDQEQSDIHTPAIIVTDSDSPTGRHSYIEILREDTFSKNRNAESKINAVTEDGRLISYDQEPISECSPLLQEGDQFEQQADVYVNKSKSKKILITDLDADTTEEINAIEISGEEPGLIDFTFSQDESVVSDLTESRESAVSDVTITSNREDSVLSYLTSTSVLPDLIVSEEESLLSETLHKEDIEADTSMGNQPTVETVYVHEDRPAVDTVYVTDDPRPQPSVEVFRDPYPPNPVNVYVEDGPRTEVFVDDRNPYPYEPPPVTVYSDNRPYDPGPAEAYNQPAGMGAYNQPYGTQPTVYPSNQPADAYRDNQPYRDEMTVSSYPDNDPYRDRMTAEPSDPYPSEAVETYDVSDDYPSNAY